MSAKPTLDDLRSQMDEQDAQLTRCAEELPPNASFDDAILRELDEVYEHLTPTVAPAALPAFFLRA